MDENSAPSASRESKIMLTGLAAGALAGLAVGSFLSWPPYTNLPPGLRVSPSQFPVLHQALAGSALGFSIAGVFVERQIRRPSAGAIPWWSIRGRIGRGSFWLRFFASVLAQNLAGWLGTFALVAFVTLQRSIPPYDTQPILTLVNIPGTLWGQFLMVAASFRRLHDLGLPGWIILLLRASHMILPPLGLKALLVAAVLQFLFVIVLGCLPGKPTANQFGDLNS